MTSKTKTGIDRTVRRGTKELRCGYTTGSCAAAAAQGAVSMLITGEIPETVTIDTPRGIELTLALEDCRPGALAASCAVVKDGGDDPDATNGLRIYAQAEYTGGQGIEIAGGTGVGQVTRKGLQIPPGEAAVNPVPRRMIRHEVRKALSRYGKDPDAGVRITLSIPGGEEVAARTFNPRLGIEGGLSILGTSGIVVPMSEDALTESMHLELSIKKEALLENGEELTAVYVPGNYGADFAAELGIPRDSVIKTSNYIGFMLDEALSMGFRKILLIGDLGKLVKVAGGNFQTHSKTSDARMEILTAHAALQGAGPDTLRRIMNCTTTAAAADIIREEGLEPVWPALADKIRERCAIRTFGEIEIAVVVFERDYGLLAQTDNAADMIARAAGKE